MASTRPFPLICNDLTVERERDKPAAPMSVLTLVPEQRQQLPPVAEHVAALAPGRLFSRADAHERGREARAFRPPFNRWPR